MTIVIAILILSAVIFFHELGHFLLAKANHVTVTEFAFGLGPRLLSFKKGETVYAWRLLPFGGFCSMLGEDEDEDAEGSFTKASVWRQIAIVAAGPVFNFILAFLVSIIVISVVGSDPARVTEVPEDSPAAAAGLQAGDIIVKYQGNGIANGRELSTDIDMDGVPADSVELTYRREGKNYKISYVPETAVRYLAGYYYSPESSGPAEITSVMEGYPAEAAGLQAGDVITEIDGTAIGSSLELAAYWENHDMNGSPVSITYTRDGTVGTAEITPVEETSVLLGFDFNLAREKMSPVNILKYSAGEMKFWIHLTVKSLGALLQGDFSVDDLSGPIGVVDAVDQVVDETRDQGTVIMGMSLLNMLILLSANLGVMNLLPLPALDGGRLIFLLIEAVRRKPIKRSVEGMIHFAGMMVLMMLMIYVAFNDVRRIF